MLRFVRPAAVLISVIILWPSVAVAQAAKAGVVTTLEGNVTVTRVTLAPQPLKFKDDVFVNDKVTTGDKAIARMLLGGKAVVTVRERSTLTITEVPGKATIDLEIGKIALAVAKEKMRPGESIEIRTSNAVAGVRGTVVVAEVTRATAQLGGVVAALVTQFHVLQGTITAVHTNPQTGAPIGPPLPITVGQSFRVAGIAPPTVQPSPPARQIVADLTPSTHQHTRTANQDEVTQQQVQTAVGLVTQILGPGSGSAASVALAVPPSVPDLPAPPPTLNVLTALTNTPVVPSTSSGGPGLAAIFGSNLIVNGGAEAGAGSVLGYDVIRPIPGWNPTGNFTVVKYTAADGFPIATDPGPSARGLNFFAGGPSNAASNASQSIDVSSGASVIAAGHASFLLSGYLGGFSSQGDKAVLSLAFKSGSGSVVGSAQIGPVSAADRRSLTGLLLRSISGPVPLSTQEIDLILQMTRLEGSYNDGYADELSLVLLDPPVSPVQVAAGSTLTSDGSLLNASGDTLSVTGDLLHVAAGGAFVQNTTAPIVSMTGGTLSVSGAMFNLGGLTIDATPDPESGLFLGTDQPLRGPGACPTCPLQASLVQATGGVINTTQVLNVDRALLEATQPLLNLTHTTLTTAADAIKLVDQAHVRLNATDMIQLNGGTLNVGGSLVSLAGGSKLVVSGNLLTVSGGATLNLLNGALLTIAGGSFARIDGSLVNFAGSGTVNITNSFCSPCITIAGLRVALLNGASVLPSDITNPIKGPGAIHYSSAGAAAIVLNGAGSKLTINGK